MQQRGRGRGRRGKDEENKGGGVACVLCPTKRFDIGSHLLFPHCGRRLPCTLARTWFVVTSVTSGGGGGGGVGGVGGVGGYGGVGGVGGGR